MNKLISFVVAVFAFCSCNSFKGKIETRKTSVSCVTYFTETIITADTAMVVDDESIERMRIQDSIINEKEKALQSNRYEIEKNAEPIYLINSSKSESYAFTIKKIYLESNLSSTSIITLQPGEEIMLGCNTEISSDKSVLKVKYDVVGEKLVK